MSCHHSIIPQRYMYVVWRYSYRMSKAALNMFTKSLSIEGKRWVGLIGFNCSRLTAFIYILWLSMSSMMMMMTMMMDDYYYVDNYDGDDDIGSTALSCRCIQELPTPISASLFRAMCHQTSSSAPSSVCPWCWQSSLRQLWSTAPGNSSRTMGRRYLTRSLDKEMRRVMRRKHYRLYSWSIYV